MRVAIRGEHLEHAVLDLQDRDVERAAAEVVHRDGAAVALVEPVRQRRGGRLVDDAQHLEPGQPASVARRRALCVVEIGRHRDHRAIDLEIELTLLAKEFLGAMLQLAQHERGDLGRRERAPADVDAHHTARLSPDAERQQRGIAADVLDAAAHEALHRIHRARRRRQQPALRLASDEDRAVLVDRHDRRHEGVARRVTDHLRHTVAHVGDEAVGGAEIDADDFTHAVVYGLRSSVFGRRWSVRLHAWRPQTGDRSPPGPPRVQWSPTDC